ncbi:potassium-transporting ATPase subunit C [Lysobacter sp. Root916]|uniref:potassium-transporting ATPase subunit KdpC n=1 Tax=Lysobacter sp. Root916 TaxID=1736606 RepID=UPI00070FAEEB|nr:potassium-transporting ATPase subunit KdpC [Lysobacter sp. Root916]KRD40075.1 potassium-transporting ATPase subunit C [Lysobacter sp. Root916]
MNTATHNPQAVAIDDRIGARAPLLFGLVALLGFGLLYSLVGAALGRLAFPWQATGSLAMLDGQARGSILVAQPFDDARYFQPRPSAANYDPMAAAGSNLARTNPDLRKRMAETALAVAERDGIALSDVPAELTTQSGGGLDPHLSPRAAQVQVARVAKARGLSAAEVDALVVAHTQPRQFGVLGEPRVNVLELNLALDARR